MHICSTEAVNHQAIQLAIITIDAIIIYSSLAYLDSTDSSSVSDRNACQMSSLSEISVFISCINLTSVHLIIEDIEVP